MLWHQSFREQQDAIVNNLDLTLAEVRSSILNRIATLTVSYPSSYLRDRM